MKFILITFILISCSHQSKESPEAKTESDAKLVSPYSVKPCYCMKIFRPVCAEKITYGNSCEAECYGHQKWTEGPCSK